MQQLGINLGPTRANIGAWGQLGVNMYLAKPEKLMFRLDGSTIFTKLYVSPSVDTLWKALEMPWEVLGTPWVDVWGGLGDALEALGDTLEDLLGGPWKNLGRTSWKPSQDPRPSRGSLG